MLILGRMSVFISCATAALAVCSTSLNAHDGIHSPDNAAHQVVSETTLKAVQVKDVQVREIQRPTIINQPQVVQGKVISRTVERKLIGGETREAVSTEAYQRTLRSSSDAATVGDNNLRYRQEIVVKVHPGPNGAKVGDVVSSRTLDGSKTIDLSEEAGREVSRRDFIAKPGDNENNYVVRERTERGKIVYRDEAVARENRVVETIRQAPAKPIQVRVIETVAEPVRIRRAEIVRPVIFRPAPVALPQPALTPQYETVEYQILETPAHTVWQTTAESPNTLCEVEVPATYRTETRQERITDGRSARPVNTVSGRQFNNSNAQSDQTSINSAVVYESSAQSAEPDCFADDNGQIRCYEYK